MWNMKWLLIFDLCIKFFLIWIFTISSLGYNFILTFVWFFRLWWWSFCIWIVTLFLFFLRFIFLIFYRNFMIMRHYWVNLLRVNLEGALRFDISWCFRMIFRNKLDLSYRFKFIFRDTCFLSFYFFHGLSFFLFFFLILLNQASQLTEKLDAEHSKKYSNQSIGNNRRKYVVEDRSHCRTEEHTWNNYHDDIVVN